jgi:hypothetical protein
LTPYAQLLLLLKLNGIFFKIPIFGVQNLMKLTPGAAILLPYPPFPLPFFVPLGNTALANACLFYFITGFPRYLRVLRS